MSPKAEAEEKLSAELRELARAGGDQRIAVIVRCKRAGAAAALASVGLEVALVIEALPIVSGAIPASRLIALAQRDEVEAIERDGEASASE